MEAGISGDKEALKQAFTLSVSPKSRKTWVSALMGLCSVGETNQGPPKDLGYFKGLQPQE